MKKLAIVIILVLTAGRYIWVQHENKEEPPVQSPNTNSAQSETTNQNINTTPTTSQAAGKTYKDGTYTGDTADAFYGMMQVQLIVSSGKITDIKFLQFPDKPGHTIEVSDEALPMLRQEAIQKQSSPVDIISGATQTSDAFNQSLASALTKAQ